MIWEVSGNSERAQSVAELWRTGDETDWSFVRKWSTEPFYLVFDCSCLLPPSPCSRDGLVHSFVPSGNCQRWLLVGTWHGRRWVYPVPCSLSGPVGSLATPNRNDGRGPNYPSSTVLHTALILPTLKQSYFLASCGGCQWGWRYPLLGLRVRNGPGVHLQRGAR